jgi:hypothetical protein
VVVVLPFVPVTPVKTNLVSMSGQPTQDFTEVFEFIEKEGQDDILILQEKADLLTWIVNQFDDGN